MATQWSDHFANSQPGLTLNQQRFAPAGLGHSRERVQVARVTLDLSPDDFGIGDVARMMTLKSGDRLLELFVSSDGAATAGAANIGLYVAGRAHDGAVIDADLFASALAYSTAINHADQFTESATLEHLDRGKPLWQLADEGGGTYSEDPFEDWDLALTGTTAITVADSEILIIARYTAGD